MLKKLMIILLAGAAYFLFMKLTDISIPCIIKLITKKHCPGCGLTRMCISIISGDIASAIRYNILITFLLPFIAVFGIRRAILYVKTGNTETDLPEKIFAIIVFVLMIVFWILRNTEAFSYLAPT